MMRPVTLSFVLVTPGLGTSRGTSAISPPAFSEPVCTAMIRIEPDVRGGGVKLNGTALLNRPPW